MKYVYNFKDGNKDMRSLLGGKGANLAEMTHLGLPVPKGFTITTEACFSYYESAGKIKAEIEKRKIKRSTKSNTKRTIKNTKDTKTKKCKKRKKGHIYVSDYFI